MEAKDLEHILDSMQTTGVHVIREDNHKILYFNKHTREMAPDIEIGMVCHELWPCGCSNCPLLHMDGKKESRSICYGHPFGNAVELAAAKILWEGHIPAVIVTITPYAEAVSYTYSKILKADLKTGAFEVVKAQEKESDWMGNDTVSLSQWFSRFVQEGKVHGRDVERFEKFTSVDYLKEALKSGKKIISCTYRRKSGSGYRWHTMEVAPVYGYSEENQGVMLYVKDMHDFYRESLEIEEVSVRNREIILSLGEVNYGIYVVDLYSGVMHTVRMPDDVGYMRERAYWEWEEALERAVQKYFHPNCREKVQKAFSLEALREAWENKEKKREMLCQRLIGGEYHFVSVTAYIHDKGKDDCFVVMAFQDVDKETRREIERNRSMMRMAAVLRAGYNKMTMVELESGMCEYVTLHADEEEGQTKACRYEDFVRQTMEEILEEEDAQQYLSLLSLENLRKRAARIEGYAEERCQYQIRQAKAVRWVEEKVYFSRQADTVLVNILERDITDKKAREELAIREKRDRNSMIQAMGSLFFAVYFINLEEDTFRMVAQTQDVGEALGKEVNLTEGFRKYANRFVHPDDREDYLEKMNRVKLREKFQEGKSMVAIEYRKLTGGDDGKNGACAWIRATVVKAQGVGQEATHALYVAQDITESKQKEERERQMLREACEAANHANASKSEFLSRMSHDIRTPMNAIIGMTSIAGAHLEEPERVSDCLGKITVSSKHLLSLINEVLDMSKIESGKIELAEEEFSLPELVQSILTIIRPAVEAKKHWLEFRIGKVEHEDVAGDAMRLQQVLINILSNAVKYTPEGGRLEIDLNERKSSAHGYGCYEFVIADNGMGMTEEYLGQIFDPFSRAEDSRISKIEGTGLGMAIALNIVRKMNGDISVESKVNEGSRFTVTVFLKQQHTELPDTRHLVDLPVLVADDDRHSCEATCAVLDEIGMKSEWVLSGKEAVGRVSEAHEDGEDFFAVILDWQMPDMDGLETARQIRRAVGEDVPIIILSAFDWSSVENEAREAGICGFISKPLFKSRLVYLFRQIAGEEDGGSISPCRQGEEAETDFGGKRILLVEDNEINREIAEEVIGNFGVIVETAIDGKQAVDKFCEKGAGYYDLIFMDVQMPVMNGYEATQAIRKSGQEDAGNIPIVAMTANAFAEDVMASRKAGMSEHITKPLDIRQIQECMGHWFGKTHG